MIKYDRLNQFIHEELRYRKDVEVLYCRIVGDKFLDLKLCSKNKKNLFEAGEIVDLERYKNWTKQFDREETLISILNEETTK